MELKPRTQQLIDTLQQRYPMLTPHLPSVEKALFALIDCYQNRGKVLVCGNGGSASDSEHIVGELMKCFYRKRSIHPDFIERFSDLYGNEEAKIIQDNLEGALPAISLVSQTGLITAFCNDVNPDYLFAQQVYGYCSARDLVWGLSTSGNSRNVVNALKVAKACGAVTLGMTGAMGGTMSSLCDITITVPETETYKVQELHLPVYHLLCAGIESEMFD